jgi:hypothetical protein
LRYILFARALSLTSSSRQTAAEKEARRDKGYRVPYADISLRLQYYLMELNDSPRLRMTIDTFAVFGFVVILN